MIKANEIYNLLSEGYEENPRYQLQGYGDKKEWELVDPEDSEELDYYLTEEGWSVRIDNVGLFEQVDSGGIYHDGGEVYHVIKFTDESGESENFVRFGRYSSWDSTEYEGWAPAESYEFTETRWRARK